MLGKRRDVVIWNNESGVATYPRHVVKYGVGKGGSDLIGVVAGGRFIALEVKTGRARPTKEQRMFLSLVQQFGGYAAIVRSEEDAHDAVNAAISGFEQVRDD